MTRRELYGLFTGEAARLYGEREARSIFFLIAGRFFGFSRGDYVIDAQAEAAVDPELAESLLRQLGSGRPVQYITGRATFCGLEFGVREGVLIPRPETEELVEWICGRWSDRSPAILDVGTGSGAIAVALARMIGGAEVTATDISEEALAIAGRNAEANGAKVGFVRHNILEEPLAGVFEVIVSNPPYIPLSERDSMAINVAGYEPHEALFVPDEDPLLFYKEIARKGTGALGKGGELYFEIHSAMASRVVALLREAGYVDIEVRNDINSRPRMIRCGR